MKKILAAVLLSTSANAFATDLVDVGKLNKNIVVDIRYNTSNNFMMRKLKGYNSNTCYLKKEAAQALAKAQEDIEKEGLSVKVFDCYRPQEAVDDMHDEVRQHKGDRLDPAYMPHVDKNKLIDLGYIARKSMHTFGRAADLTLVDMRSKKELDMGTPFDTFDNTSWTADTTISKQAQSNRKKLVSIMERHGFANFNKEWWHFNYTK
ncbi:M15 family metallopeptidase [Burkholderia cepacia]|uniref:M15 family metallopeptidase n=1 Tax=Burkholderia cepacia TaxID=292 RepID=UPI0026DFF415|nr:M15 family metallopeptidase [Burkholderia cepacia]MDO5943344.1 M15 family metallopeptidase [Burkholderia cepacia]